MKASIELVRSSLFFVITIGFVASTTISEEIRSADYSDDVFVLENSNADPSETKNNSADMDYFICQFFSTRDFRTESYSWRSLPSQLDLSFSPWFSIRAPPFNS